MAAQDYPKAFMLDVAGSKHNIATAAAMPSSPSPSMLRSLKPDIEDDRQSVDSRRSFMSRMSSASMMDQPPPSPGVPVLPETKFEGLSLSFDLESLMGHSRSLPEPDIDPRKKEQVEKRQSNVQRLAAEIEKLNSDLKATSERIRQAEERQKRLSATQNNWLGTVKESGDGRGGGGEPHALPTAQATR